MTHLWRGQARTRGAEIRPFSSWNVRQRIQSASQRVKLRLRSSLSSPSAEFSGKHLTPARFPKPCLLLLTLRRDRGGITATKVAVSNCWLPTRFSCSLFFRQVGDARVGNCYISASIPVRFIKFGWESSVKTRGKFRSLRLEPTAEHLYSVSLKCSCNIHPNHLFIEPTAIC